jgi:hypothetical protein
MWESVSPFAAARMAAIALGIILVALVALWGYRRWQRSRITPEERERQRRAWLVAMGKMGDAMLLEIHDSHLLYSYDVRGVEYTASQDVTCLPVPSDLSNAPALSVKYDPKNPANSIVVAEEWSGLRGRG